MPVIHIRVIQDCIPQHEFETNTQYENPEERIELAGSRRYLRPADVSSKYRPPQFDRCKRCWDFSVGGRWTSCSYPSTSGTCTSRRHVEKNIGSRDRNNARR